MAIERGYDAAAHGDRTEYSLGDYRNGTTIAEEDRPSFYKQYGRVRSHFRLNPERYTDLQRWLNQARYGQNFDVYLTHSAYYAAIAAVIGVLSGAVLTLGLVESGIIETLSNPFAVSGDITSYIGQNRGLVAALASMTILGALSGAGVWYLRYYYPRVIVSRRRRNIQVTLPHAITFMYALSYGGMDLLSVFRVLSDSQDTYGEVANEFEMIIRDVELFGSDLNSAMQNARNLTPSDNLEQFLDDLVSVLDSGGDVTVFLENEADNYLEDAQDEQRSFLETLSLLSEFFVVMFVAAPLFLIVILIVMSLLGANTLSQVTLLVYVAMPLAMLLFLILLDTLSEPFVQPDVTLEEKHHATAVGTSRLLALVAADYVKMSVEWLDRSAHELVGKDPTPAVDTERYETNQRNAYLRQRRRRHLREALRTPFAIFDESPALTLVLTVPVAIVLVAFAILSGAVTPSVDGFLDAPFTSTIWVGVAPLLVVAVPLSIFVERQVRRERSIAQQFPDTLNALSSANKMGVPTVEALGLVSKWSSGPIETELNKVSNDLEWNHDMASALRSFADRLRVPQLSRAIKLIAEGLRSSSDLARVLSIAAEDTRNRFKIDQQRRRELSTYVVVVILGYLVYLIVVALLTAAYLNPIAETAAQTPSSDVASPVSISNLPITAYETLFFHSAIIQGFGSGLLAGKLVNDNALTGLKYGLGLVILAVIVFMVI